MDKLEKTATTSSVSPEASPVTMPFFKKLRLLFLRVFSVLFLALLSFDVYIYFFFMPTV